MHTSADRDRFAATFDALSPRVFAYARRHCDPTTAQDVVSDTFLIAWRRWADVPPQAMPWLLVVARNSIANRHRSTARRNRLVAAVGNLERVAAPAIGPDQTVVERAAMVHALGELTELEREALLLVAWDGLKPADAAEVAGCSARAFEVRLSRARARLTRAMTEPTPDGSAAHDRHQASLPNPFDARPTRDVAIRKAL